MINVPMATSRSTVLLFIIRPSDLRRGAENEESDGDDTKADITVVEYSLPKSELHANVLTENADYR